MNRKSTNATRSESCPAGSRRTPGDVRSRYVRFCMQCGWGFTAGQWPRANFCPSCGAQVRRGRNPDRGREESPRFRPSIQQTAWQARGPLRDADNCHVAHQHPDDGTACDAQPDAGAPGAERLRQFASAVGTQMPMPLRARAVSGLAWARENPAKAGAAGLAAGGAVILAGTGLKLASQLFYGLALGSAFLGVVVLAVTYRGRAGRGPAVGGKLLLLAGGLAGAGLACDMVGTLCQVGGAVVVVGSTGVLAWQGCRTLSALLASPGNANPQDLPAPAGRETQPDAARQ